MKNLGYDGAAISLGSLFTYNSNAKWAYSMGFTPTTKVEGFPVLLRFLFNDDYKLKALIAMYFDQPIILMGHHNDLKTCGIGILNSISDYINSLGLIRWTNMSNIFCSLYSHTTSYDTIFINMHSNKIRFQIPNNIDKLKIVNLKSNLKKYVISLNGKDFSVNDIVKKTDHFSVPPGNYIEIKAFDKHPRSFTVDNYIQLNLWALIRRQLTEIRDRLYPIKDYLLR